MAYLKELSQPTEENHKKLINQWLSQASNWEPSEYVQALPLLGWRGWEFDNVKSKSMDSTHVLNMLMEDR
jgi:hypothetical protein